jgi:signal peptidase II
MQSPLSPPSESPIDVSMKMSKRDWLLVFGLVPAVWIIDQITKAWASRSLFQMKFYGPVGFVLHHNRGAIWGTFSDLPPLLRVVSLSTGGAFLIFIFFALQYLLPLRGLAIRTGMSLLLGGILGNVTDRIVHGEVCDFILLGSRSLWSPAFNLADAIQWGGYILLVMGLLRDGAKLWPDVNARKNLWINPRFQWKYIMVIVGIGTSFAVVSGVFAYTFLKVTIDDLVVGPAHLSEHRFLVPFLQTYAVISLGFMITLFLLGRILSHRTAGPVFAFEAYLKDLLGGKDRQFRLRQGDEFKHLEELAEILRPLLKDAAQKPPVERLKQVL